MSNPTRPVILFHYHDIPNCIGNGSGNEVIVIPIESANALPRLSRKIIIGFDPFLWSKERLLQPSIDEIGRGKEYGTLMDIPTCFGLGVDGMEEHVQVWWNLVRHSWLE